MLYEFMGINQKRFQQGGLRLAFRGATTRVGGGGIATIRRFYCTKEEN